MKNFHCFKRIQHHSRRLGRSHPHRCHRLQCWKVQSFGSCSKKSSISEKIRFQFKQTLMHYIHQLFLPQSQNCDKKLYVFFRRIRYWQILSFLKYGIHGIFGQTSIVSFIQGIRQRFNILIRHVYKIELWWRWKSTNVIRNNVGC